jgi:HAD superfamily hydrolase (TIGR01549 family)
MKKIVVYDCDGVLFDSLGAIISYYDYLFKKFNLPKPEWESEEFKKIAMMGTCRNLLNHVLDDQKFIDEIIEFAAELNFEKFIPEMIPAPNIYDALGQLQDNGHNLAICTNRGVSLHSLLEHFDMGKYFSYTISTMEVAKPKPDPEGLIKIMDKFNAKNEHLLFIGDSEADYMAAKNAKVPFLAYENELGESPLMKNHMEIFDHL